ncbi:MULTISPECIES: Ig-like domain-containing protein, partial [unclassified Blastococcus]
MRLLPAATVAVALVVLLPAPASADPVNQAPVVVDDEVALRSTAMSQWVWPLDNDSDPDGDQLTYTAVTPGAKGRTYVSNGWLYYQPYPGTTAGTDSFTYTVSDGNGHSGTGTVTVTLWDDPGVPGDVAISSADPDGVTLTWTAAAGATRYRVHRNDTVFETTGLTWTDTGLQDVNSYSWSVAAVNDGGFEGSWSTSVHREARLSTPWSLTVDVTGDPTTLSLDWDGVGPGPWNVYRDGALLASTPVSDFEDTGLETGREYSYQVQTTFPSTARVVYPPSALSAAVTGTPVELSPIGRLFWDRGWTAGDLGPVTVPERAVPGGRQQDHVNGVILQQDGADPYAVTADFARVYALAGGVSGDLGFPVEDQQCGLLRDDGCAQFFEGGSVWDSAVSSAQVVRGVIEEGWAATGWEEGPLGYPIGSQFELPNGVGQSFEDGGVYWSAATGSHGVIAETHDAYGAAGGPAGRLGHPTTDDNCGLVGGGCWQGFQGGVIHWSPATGAHVTSGAIRDAWGRTGWEFGRLGYPTTDANCGLVGGGCWQGFQGGVIHWSPATGAHVTSGAIRDTWGRWGWEFGRLGYPTTEANCGLRGGGCWQGFQGGVVHWSPASGAHATFGAIRDAWGRTGW